MKRTIDVSALPEHAFFTRSTLFWGICGLIAIESTMFALLVGTYFYVRGNFGSWPPSGTGHAALIASAIGLAALVVSIVTMHRVNVNALAERIRGMRAWLIVTNILGLVFLVTRWRELAHLPFRWDDHAYGSVFWMLVGMHTVHGLAGVTENFVLIALLFKGPVEKKHCVDIWVNGIYWYFIVVVWIPIWAILYLEGPVLGK